MLKITLMRVLRYEVFSDLDDPDSAEDAAIELVESGEIEPLNPKAEAEIINVEEVEE